MPAAAPRLLHLANGRALPVVASDGRLTLALAGERIELAGIYAEAVLSLLDSAADATTRKRLQLIERLYPWLQGLAAANSNPDWRSRLFGSDLGVLFVELTARCNERCLHCYADSDPERREILSLAELRDWLAAARQLGQATVQFTGGDPLLHPDLPAALATARALDFAGVEIYTNGLHLSGRLLQQLLPHRPDFAFSLYSHRAEIHDAITRTPGSHVRTLQAIRRVQEAGCPLRIGVALMALNGTDGPAILDFALRELATGAEQIRFDPVRRSGRGIGVDSGEGSLYSLAHLPERAGEMRRGKLCIGFDGRLYPCIFNRLQPLGDLRRQSLAEILAALTNRPLAAPDAARWQSCGERLSCSDCRAIAYALGDAADG